MNILSLNSDFNKYFSQINFKFSKPESKHLSTFVEGLISSDGKKTLCGICKNTMFPRERSAFNNFLIYSPWDAKELNKARIIDSLNAMKEANDNSTPYFFSIDDTILSKNISSKKIEGLKFNYSHVSGKSEWSHCLVSLHGHSNGIPLPLDFKSYLSEEFWDEQNGISFKSKPKLAIDILKKMSYNAKKKVMYW